MNWIILGSVQNYSSTVFFYDHMNGPGREKILVVGVCVGGPTLPTVTAYGCLSCQMADISAKKEKSPSHFPKGKFFV